MQRYIEEQNIAHFQRLLLEETDQRSRRFIQEQLLASRRRLATLMAVATGLKTNPQIIRERTFPHPETKLMSKFRHEFEMATTPQLLIDPGGGLHIVDANQTYAAATMIEPRQSGRRKDV
ncbi:hypothetical protein [Bradyrhizobium guangdongense]|nr:hypothetical protein [Bradyrhizobium guangdongense]